MWSNRQINTFTPSFFEGVYKGTLDQASVPVECPQLLSKGVMKKWDVDLCFGKGVIKIHKFGIEVPFNSRGVPMVNILDVTAEQVRDQMGPSPMAF